MEVNPLNIFFVKSDSKGDRLLFRYPYTTDVKDENKEKKSGRQNPYAITIIEDLLQCPQPQTSNLCKGQLSGFTDEMLSTLFAVKAELCNTKFELKVNDVRFVGHPTLLPYRSNNDAATIVVNIVFALQASASHTVVKCYYDLSRRLGKALRHEEKRCSYLTKEMKIMLTAHDEISTLDTESNSGENEDEEENSRHSVSSTALPENSGDTAPKSAFHLILQRSSLARSMKAVFEELTNAGIVQVRINDWVLLSFCLPHKAHQIDNNGVTEPENIDKCLQRLRPYHGILLMVNPNELLTSIPLDGSPALLRLVKMYSPLKSLQTLAIETDLTLTQVFQLTGHLVYWAKATVIYPLCEGNVYVIAPAANIYVNSPHVEEFAKEFPGLTLMQVLSEFSLPAPLWYHSRGYAGGADGTRLARVTTWLLRRRMLLQLHTYVKFNGINWGRDDDEQEYFCEKHDTYNKSNSVSFSSLNHMQLNVPEPVETRSSSKLYDYDDGYPTENKLNLTDFTHTKPIVISSHKAKYEKFEEPDSANHSFQDGVDVVDGIKTKNGCDYENNKDKNINAYSVDSGISNNVDANNQTEMNMDASNNIEVTNETINPVSKLTKKLSDLSTKDGNLIIKETSTDGDTFGVHSDDDKSSRQKKSNSMVNGSCANEKKNGISLNLKLQSEMGFQPPTVWNASSGCDVLDTCRPPVEPLSEETALEAFTEEERTILASLPAAQNPEDLLLLAQLHKKGYFRGEHHLEEIMFMENVSRSQLMQLLDKFREVLITVETEDPAVALLYPY